MDNNIEDESMYYVAPSDGHFNEVKEKAIEIWERYLKKDEFSGDYVASKVDIIKDLPNIQDNLMCIVSMFDMINKAILADMLSYGARKAVRDRLHDAEDWVGVTAFMEKKNG